MIANPKAPYIVAHHFNNAPGITMDFKGEGWVFREWPASLGAEPTETDVQTWEADYAKLEADRQIPDEAKGGTVAELRDEFNALRKTLIARGVL